MTLDRPAKAITPGQATVFYDDECVFGRGWIAGIFIDTVASNYRKRLADRGIADGECGAVTVIQRANSDLRLSPHFHVLQLVTAPGEGEVTVVTDETIGEKDPLLARLLAAATAGAPPAGPAHKRAPVHIVLDPDATPVAKGKLCGQHRGFNLHAQT